MTHAKKKLKQKRRKCSDCGRIFANAGARGTHWKAAHYVPPPKPPPPPEKEHVNFMALIEDSKNLSWGVNMTKAERKSPSMEQLTLGAMLCILSELRQIKQELRRTKTIS